MEENMPRPPMGVHCNCIKKRGILICMIFIDRLVRYFAKDIYLPLRCYANKRQLLNRRDCCNCKIYCKKPPNGGTPALQEITILKYNDSIFYNKNGASTLRTGKSGPSAFRRR
jgi:hypothetical protein